MKLTLKKPDTFGALASTLCAIHCIATPFLFIVQSCAIGGCETAPLWWKSLDFLFLAISFIAVFQSVKTTSKKIMKPILWFSWFILCMVIFNERIDWIPIPKTVMYIVTFKLAILHTYNLKYCQCSEKKYCNN